MTASSILGLDTEGRVMEGQGEPELSGACIHLGVRRTRPGAKVNTEIRIMSIELMTLLLLMQVVMHTHTPYATALGCLEDPSLVMTHQNSCRCRELVS